MGNFVNQYIKHGRKQCEIKMGSQGLQLLMELKFLIMITRPQNIIVAGNSNVLWLGHHYQ